jgi:AcrR family transcriptional regulator
MTPQRKPGQRAGLTESQVRTEALAMLDEAGADGLTMRGLADRLGVHANTLYSYTSNKMSLIDDVLDDVLADVESPRPGDDAATALRTIMRSTYGVLLTHHRLASIYMQRQGARGPNAQRLGDIMIDVLDQAGIVGTRAKQAQHVLVVYAIGSAAYYTSDSTTTEVSPPDDDPDVQAFHSGLDWLITGIGA